MRTLGLSNRWEIADALDFFVRENDVCCQKKTCIDRTDIERNQYPIRKKAALTTTQGEQEDGHVRDKGIENRIWKKVESTFHA